MGRRTGRKRERKRERVRRAERRGKFHRTRRPWRVVRTEGTKTYDDKKKSMRRARKFYGISESRRQVVGEDDYKGDIGKEEEWEGGWNESRRVTCPVYYRITYDRDRNAPNGQVLKLKARKADWEKVSKW